MSATESTSPWRLLLIGAGDVARELAELAPRLGFAVSLCEPRAERRVAWPAPAEPWLDHDPIEALRQFVPDIYSAVVALAHVPAIDDAALIGALPSPAFYVGAIGSRANAEARLARLSDAGISETDCLRLKAPIGLPIGSRSPAEIAIAILAELIDERRRQHAATTGPLCVAAVS
ncbi:XdhC family protein [Crenobacter sp. SG2303]|uniref:XdhC family protein n=1 Tax=Crenobacter oryzisoli TaxID=3056844 RepID=A0ABT7XNC9_9NEIS|nr:XdhC family protein [Crenobacter sp. SG2303]MDN0075287.1 XdhC family protein [Crenobacter sp. SG2303]